MEKKGKVRQRQEGRDRRRASTVLEDRERQEGKERRRSSTVLEDRETGDKYQSRDSHCLQ